MIEEQTVICVVGIGRSGTSLTTRVLNLLGVDLGPESGLVPASRINPTGFWERSGFDELNRRVLWSLGGGMSNPPTFEPGWSPPDELANDARALIEECFGSKALWGWKDPKNCLTLPFWQSLLPPMRYVICLRDPREVAASLRRRSESIAADADRIWLGCTARALVYTAGRPRIIVPFDRYFQDPDGLTASLASFIGREPPAAETTREVRQFIDEDLRHHAAAAADDHDSPPEVRGLYEVVRRVCDATPVADGSSTAAELHRAADRYAYALIDRDDYRSAAS